jgi:hypothetical protein
MLLWATDGATQGFRSFPLPLQAAYLRIASPAVLDMPSFFAPGLVFDDTHRTCALWVVEMPAYHGSASVEVTYALASADTGTIVLTVATTTMTPVVTPEAVVRLGLADALPALAVTSSCRGTVPPTVQTDTVLRCPVADGLSLLEGAWLAIGLCRAADTTTDTAPGAVVVRKVRLVAGD